MIEKIRARYKTDPAFAALVDKWEKAQGLREDRESDVRDCEEAVKEARNMVAAAKAVETRYYNQVLMHLKEKT